MPTDQPTGMQNDNGLILTIGVGGADAGLSAVVLPMCSDSDIDKNKSANSFIDGFTGDLSAFTGIISSDAFIAFIQVEGMVDGIVPARKDFAPTDQPGTRGAGLAPAQVSALAYWYEDSRDVVGPTEKLRVGKCFLPGLCKDDVGAVGIVSDVVDQIGTWANDLQAGITDGDGNTWYRVLAAPKPRTPGQDIRRTYANGGRNYICTQRRRLLPRL